MTPKVSVITCHHKGDQFIPALIKSLKKTRKITYEVICVTSTDMTFQGARMVRCDFGPSVKRNVGAQFAKGEYFAFLDDDTEVEPDCLYEMVKVCKRPGVGMVYGKTYNMERRTRFDGAGSFLTSTGFLWAREENGIEDVGQYDIEEPIFAGKGASMMLKKSSFEKVGGFEPVYEILAEETDISWKVWFIGEKVMWAPKAVLYHAFNTKFKPWNYYYTNKRVYFNGARNYLLMHLKFLEWKNVFKILPILTLGWFVAGFGMILSGKLQAGLNIWKGIAYHLFYWKDTMERRRKVQLIRKLSDKEIFKTIMKNPPLSFFINRMLNYWKTGAHG